MINAVFAPVEIHLLYRMKSQNCSIGLWCMEAASIFWR